MNTHNLTHTSNNYVNLFPILDTFFDQQELIDYQRQIWELTIAFASQPDDVQLSRLERSNMIFFCAKLNELFYALHEVWNSDRVRNADKSIESNGID